MKKMRVKIMGKKHYDVTLDEEAVIALDRWLEAAGINRSAYLNTLIVKSVEAMKLDAIPDYSKMSIIDLFSMVGGLGKMMKGKVK
jgi:hypothetical protein